MFGLSFRDILTRPGLLVGTISAILAVITVMIVGLLDWTTSRVDIASANRETGIVSAALGRSAQRIAREQEASTVWDEAVTHVVNDTDPEWLDANLGIWMHTYYGHDRTYVLNARDEPLYAMADGKRVAPETLRYAGGAILGVVHDLRTKLRTGHFKLVDRQQSPGASDIAIIDSHPAIISAKPIVSDTGRYLQVAGSEPVHVSVRYLDGDFVAQFATNYLLRDARFSWLDNRHANDIVLPLVGNHGVGSGYLIWSPFRPGESVRQSINPALVFGLGAVSLIVAFLLLALHQGASALTRSEAQLRFIAEHDPLTGLPNRTLFHNRLQEQLNRVARNGETLSLLSVDLDRFKQVNDSLGHPAGDELLRQVARRLCKTVRPVDTVARLGGDEFSIILTDVQEELSLAIAARIIESIGEPFDVLGHRVSIGSSIGFAHAPADGSDSRELIRRSDFALYVAKERGRGRAVKYQPSLERPTVPRPELVSAPQKLAGVGDLSLA